MDSSIKVQFRKTKKGKINKIVEEVYLRDEIYTPLLEQSMEGDLNTIYIIDLDAFSRQIDLIENCKILQNVIVLQTILEEIRSKDQKSFETIKNLIEVETHRNFYLFANEHLKDTYVPKKNNETLSQRNQRAVYKAVSWYTQQARNNDKKVVFISNNPTFYSQAKQDGIDCFTIYDFVKLHSAEQPDLLDYIGFDDSQVEQEGEQIYPTHLEIEKLIQKVRRGELFEGKLSMLKGNNQQGRIFLNMYGFDIKLVGMKNLNRALNGDKVVVEMLPESEWEKVRYNDLEEDDDVAFEQDSHQIQVEENNQDSNLKQLIKKIHEQDLAPTGKVVGIIQRIGRKFCGQLKPADDNLSKTDSQFQIREFVPADQRYPNIHIRVRNNNNLDDKKIIVKIDSWDHYSSLPKGHFVSIIGKAGDDITEGNLILLEHNVEIKQFSRQVLDCLPPESDNWQIPQDEYAKRKDFRDYPVCSIDPPGCKDIDDALHCRILPNGNFEAGVHIADVSHFVKPDAAIDIEAANRCTTVYLVGRRTDMLPKLLTENLCSLRGGVERLTFSVIWEMTPDAKIVKTEYMKGVIKSKSAMTYGDAQKIVDDPNNNTEIGQSVKGLNKIAKILRQRRIDSGALTLASTQVKFSFSDETHNPTDVQLYEYLETNHLVEEFMLLANVATAEKILYHFPSNGILRRHTQPKPKQIKEFAKLLNSLGYYFDYSSSKNLADSLDNLKKEKDPFFNKLTRILTTRTMNEANYFCTADADYPEFFHYGLACPCYTHFTSPIRRYADILVHRLLAASIDLESLPKTMANKQKLTKVCDRMNMRHRNARNAGRASSDYHTYLFFRGKDIKEAASITSISHNGFSVIISKYGFEGFIQLNSEDEKNHQKFIKSQIEKDPEYILSEITINGQKLQIFEQVDVRVTVELEHFHKKIHLEYLGKTQ